MSALPSVSIRRVWALCRKESWQILRDPSSILIAFIMPVLLLFTMGYGINADLDHVPIGLEIHDDGELAHDFAQALMVSPAFEVHTGVPRRQLLDDVAHGRLRGIVIIRSDFSKRWTQGGGDAGIQILADGVEPNTASFIGAYVRNTWQQWKRGRQSGGEQKNIAIESRTRSWFNPSTISRNFLVPGEISVVMTIIGALLTSLVVAREWERGTMELLLSTPMTRTEFLISKILPYYVLGLAAMAISLIVSIGIMGIPFRGSLLVLIVILTAFLGAALGLGLYISSALRNQFNAAQAALSAAFLPSLMLSGMIYEIGSMPTIVQWLTHLISARYFTNSLQTIFLVPDFPMQILENLLALLLLTALWVGLAASATKRTLD